jgi:hypothetical protein
MHDEAVSEVLQELSDKGSGVLHALKQVRSRCAIDLGQAKVAMANHPAWTDARAGMIQWSELGQLAVVSGYPARTSQNSETSS